MVELRLMVTPILNELGVVETFHWNVSTRVASIHIHVGQPGIAS
jgi:hypothetical protein